MRHEFTCKVYSVYFQQKHLLAKFRMAVKLTIFCARNFKEHCLRYVFIDAPFFVHYS